MQPPHDVTDADVVRSPRSDPVADSVNANRTSIVTDLNATVVANVEVAGSIPISFVVWGIAQSEGYGLLGSLADHGVTEFLLILHRT